MSSMTDIYETLCVASQPMSVSDLLAEHPSVPRRTVQRWLGKLVEDNKVQMLGEGRSRRYVIATEEISDPVADRSDNFPSYIPLSEDSKDILRYIDQPTKARTPVGYQREFLESYEPNVTYYLPVPIRNQLWRIGDTKQISQPAGTYGRAILDRLLIDLSWASSYLEGNTYSRLDTVKLIEYGKIAEGKNAIETQMILNHKAAIELLVDGIEELDFNRYTVLNLHSALSENLLSNPVYEGRIRQHQVEIGKSVFRPLSGEAHISEILDSLLGKARAISDPFEQSFFMMVHLPYLQPFADVNKRTSRLVANLPLIRSNLCPLTFVDVPEEAYSRAMLGIYEMTRVELLRDLYLWAYERSAQEYLAVTQGITAPDPLRLQYRNVIKQIVYRVVATPEMDSIDIIDKLISDELSQSERDTLKALVIEELRRLHEGVLARYGLRPSQFEKWKRKHR
ncbi:Fic family protein [Photorhabdus luminescens subsp. sonorensis]|uniref:Fic family protein n=2 Tax=Photorhabdus luminescens TaxID=29488 RepID=A0A5C4RF78_PHOLU|nr:Fic family protein [Photorhabdus luminescens subsp. sonorensis]